METNILKQNIEKKNSEQKLINNEIFDHQENYLTTILTKIIKLKINKCINFKTINNTPELVQKSLKLIQDQYYENFRNKFGQDIIEKAKNELTTETDYLKICKKSHCLLQSLKKESPLFYKSVRIIYKKANDQLKNILSGTIYTKKMPIIRLITEVQYWYFYCKNEFRDLVDEASIICSELEESKCTILTRGQDLLKEIDDYVFGTILTKTPLKEELIHQEWKILLEEKEKVFSQMRMNIEKLIKIHNKFQNNLEKQKQNESNFTLLLRSKISKNKTETMHKNGFNLSHYEYLQQLWENSLEV